MVAEPSLFEQVTDVIAASRIPEKLLTLKATEAAKIRDKELSQLEIEELNICILAERYMRLAKAKALLAIRGNKAA